VGVGVDYRRVGKIAHDTPHEGLMLDKPESPLPPIDRQSGKLLANWGGDPCIIAHGLIRHLLEHKPMIAEQRRILVMALGVLDSFA
jgi:hypothetical protein